MAYGNFSEDGSRYRITTPDTPWDWSNYLFNDRYYMTVSQTAQGSSTSLIQPVTTFTRGYRAFYIVDKDSSACWSPSYAPLKTRLDSYSCTHALGWTEIAAGREGIASTIRVFVPLEGLCEIWIHSLKNTTGRRRSLSYFSVYSMVKSAVSNEVGYDRESRILWSRAHPRTHRWTDRSEFQGIYDRIFLFSNRPVISFDTNEWLFYGRNGHDEVPAAVVNGGCTSVPSSNYDLAGALEHDVALEPDEETSFITVLGYCNGLDVPRGLRQRFAAPEAVAGELENVERYWRERCATCTVETPDGDLDRFANFWIKKQIIAMARTSRCRTMSNHRNELQDRLGYSLIDIEDAGRLMRKAMADQHADGYIKQFYMIDNVLPPTHLATLEHRDGPVWLVVCYCVYVNQTGDAGALDVMIPFQDTAEKAPAYDHMLRAIEYLAADTGEHGLNLQGDGDWNDPINAPGRNNRGESVWITLALKFACLRLLPLCEHRGDRKAAGRLKEIMARIDDAVTTHCWDGEWFIRGFADDGLPYGSARDTEARLFLNAQTWALMARVVDPSGERGRKCLAAIDSLDTDCGPAVCRPHLTGWNPRLGNISLKIPGTTENGSVYCHAGMFKAYADCVAGRGTKAYETLVKSLPTNPKNPPERNLQVPIFVPNYYFGLTDRPEFGQSSHFNNTGTAAWWYYIAVERLLGIRATVEGLRIDPCIPAGWREYRVTRSFRGARYAILVTNPEGVERGVRRIIVDGMPVTGVVLPCEPGRDYAVQVVMGGGEEEVRSREPGAGSQESGARSQE